jgi:cold shock CspA family protein
MASESLRGEVRFYDESTEWGVIAGDDGRLYTLRAAHIQGRQPRAGERVAFDPVDAFGGPRATAVRRLSER